MRRRAEWLQETRLMRIEEAYEGWTGSRLTQEEAALPARATTVVAFIDAMAKVKAPATVRRYVSSIATVQGRSAG